MNRVRKARVCDGRSLRTYGTNNKDWQVAAPVGRL